MKSVGQTQGSHNICGVKEAEKANANRTKVQRKVRKKKVYNSLDRSDCSNLKRCRLPLVINTKESSKERLGKEKSVMKYTKIKVSAVSPRIDWKTINWQAVIEYVKKLLLIIVEKWATIIV